MVHVDSAAAGSATPIGRRTRSAAWCLRGAGMIGMSFLNPLCCVLAMNFASPSILAPFSGLTLVWIVLLSSCLINEQPSSRQRVAAALIVLGEVIVAVFGDHTNNEGMTLEDLEASYSQPSLWVCFGGLAVWMGIVVNWMVHPDTPPLLRRFGWGVAGGSITGLQNFLKDSLTALKASHGRPLPWFEYLFVFLAAATAFGGLLFLTACMKRYDATYSSAMFVGSFVVSASIVSAVHYNTFQHLSSIWDWVLYPTGLLILMVGVTILAVEAGENDEKDVNTKLVDVEDPDENTGSVNVSVAARASLDEEAVAFVFDT